MRDSLLKMLLNWLSYQLLGGIEVWIETTWKKQANKRFLAKHLPNYMQQRQQALNETRQEDDLAGTSYRAIEAVHQKIDRDFQDKENSTSFGSKAVDVFWNFRVEHIPSFCAHLLKGLYRFRIVELFAASIFVVYGISVFTLNSWSVCEVFPGLCGQAPIAERENRVNPLDLLNQNTTNPGNSSDMTSLSKSATLKKSLEVAFPAVDQEYFWVTGSSDQVFSTYEQTILSVETLFSNIDMDCSKTLILVGAASAEGPAKRNRDLARARSVALFERYLSEDLTSDKCVTDFLLIALSDPISGTSSGINRRLVVFRLRDAFSSSNVDLFFSQIEEVHFERGPSPKQFSTLEWSRFDRAGLQLSEWKYRSPISK